VRSMREAAAVAAAAGGLVLAGGGSRGVGSDGGRAPHSGACVGHKEKGELGQGEQIAGGQQLGRGRDSWVLGRSWWRAAVVHCGWVGGVKVGASAS
jgi:hypothetical protein